MTTSTGVDVTVSTDAGAYYCEHVFFAAHEVSMGYEGSVLKDEEGKRLIGFLHIPEAHDQPGSPERHYATQEVVAAGLRGFYAAAITQIDEPFRIHFTGFGPFDTVVDNPSGAFVEDGENLMECINLAFGNEVPPISLHRSYLEADPTSIDRGPISIQHELQRTRPHAVISLGLARGRDTFAVETVATAKQLSRHGGLRVPEDVLYENDAFVRAIQLGAHMIWG